MDRRFVHLDRRHQSRCPLVEVSGFSVGLDTCWRHLNFCRRSAFQSTLSLLAARERVLWNRRRFGICSDDHR